MVRRLQQLYARRIVNINVNIVLAGLLALIPLTGVVHVMTRLGVTHKWTITGVTFIADISFDVLIYFILHWWANHAGPRRQRTQELLHADLSYFRSVTLVQFERAALSPLLYTMALGLQRLLMHWEWKPEYATIIGFLVGISSTRVLHTIWMIEQERRARARLRTRAAAPGEPIMHPAPERQKESA
jgi:hypothetical protein